MRYSIASVKAAKPNPGVRENQWMEGLEDRRLMSVTLSAGTFGGAEGRPLKGTVATFVSSDATPQSRKNYAASIDWGDGTTSVGLVTPDRKHAGQFDIIARHRYAAAGVFSPVVSVHDAVDNTDATVNDSTTITDVPLKASRKHVNATAGASFTRTVAIVNDRNRFAVAGDFTATIDWGDGSATSSGTVLANGHGTFSILGTHSYAAAGRFPITVTIADSGGSSITIVSDAKVKA